MEKKLPVSLLRTIPEETLEDMDVFEASQFLEPSVSIRRNPFKAFAEDSSHEPVPWSNYGYYLKERPIFTADPFLHAGAYYVQEASSMFLEYALRQSMDLTKANTVLDLCAAPGGKSTLVASMLSQDSLLVSNEVIHSRAGILCENMTKWGLLNTWVSNSDPKQFGKLDSIFDALIIDAPCSGSGLFRRIPEYMDEWTIENVNLCIQRQKRILHDSYNCLAQDGILVYMTCSYSQAENEDIVDYICAEFDVDSIELQVPSEWNVSKTWSPVKKGVGYRFYPHKVKGEGFFLAIFKKKDGSPTNSGIPRKQDHRKFSFLHPYINLEKKYILQQKDAWIAIHENHQELLSILSGQIKLIKKGIMLGKVIRDELIPDHELAMYTNCIYHVKVDMNLEDAIAYLKKNEVKTPEAQRGWNLVTYKGISLGWIKNLGQRSNNYYPGNYRILSKNILPNR